MGKKLKAVKVYGWQKTLDRSLDAMRGFEKKKPPIFAIFKVTAEEEPVPGAEHATGMFASILQPEVRVRYIPHCKSLEEALKRARELLKGRRIFSVEFVDWDEA